MTDEDGLTLVTVVLSGTARGADTLGENWARRRDVPVERHPADWETHGKRAGFIRNALMVKKADMLVAFWDGKSKGTEHVIGIAKKAGLQVTVVEYTKG
jgi:hypothetical protein